MSGGQSRPPNHPNDFRIGILCALPEEASMVLEAFDEIWDKRDGHNFERLITDYNRYKMGRISGMNAVLTLCPEVGGQAAAQVADTLRHSFTKVEIIFIVGICGAVPTYSRSGVLEDIMLGDCIFGSGMIHFDLGERGPGGLRRANDLDAPGRSNSHIRALMAELRIPRSRRQLTDDLHRHLQEIQIKNSEYDEKEDIDYPGIQHDRLYKPDYIHTHHSLDKLCVDCDSKLGICRRSCEDLGCEDQYLKHRSRIRPNTFPRTHVGYFGSSSSALKDGRERDELAKANNIIGFEMEGFGVWDIRPTVLIKAACDYADSHINKRWQPYAAAVAAAGLKALLGMLDLPGEGESERSSTNSRAQSPARGLTLFDHDVYSLRRMQEALPDNVQNGNLCSHGPLHISNSSIYVMRPYSHFQQSISDNQQGPPIYSGGLSENQSHFESDVVGIGSQDRSVYYRDELVVDDQASKLPEQSGATMDERTTAETVANEDCEDEDMTKMRLLKELDSLRLNFPPHRALREEFKHLHKNLSRNNQPLLSPGFDYWSHMTYSGHKAYTRIYSIMCMTSGKLNILWFARNLGNYAPTKAQDLVDMWKRFDIEPEEAMREAYIVALIYMLHIEVFTQSYSAERPNMTEQRLKRLRAFVTWHPCSEGQNCNLQWNFSGRDWGMWRGSDGHARPPLDCILHEYWKIKENWERTRDSLKQHRKEYDASEAMLEANKIAILEWYRASIRS